MPDGIPAPDEITLEAFQEALARYPSVIQAVSQVKATKAGQRSLAELDGWRYASLPEKLGRGADKAPMLLDDVQTLVEWKLRHGTFRPTLMKLVQSNPHAAVRDTVAEAIGLYRDAEDGTPATAAALRVLCRLRGIGPATASLLLAVHDPQHVPFFGDELYAWLCGGPARARPAKYTEREYSDVCAQTAALRTRLGVDAVRAVDVEQVAYVLLRSDKTAARDSKSAVKETTAKKTPSGKRKRPAEADSSTGPVVRRSARHRKA